MTVAPPGYRYEWVEEDTSWTMDPAIVSGRRCRSGATRGRPSCGEPAVAALRRGYSRPQWWCYCPAHLYGRRIGVREADGVVRRVVESKRLVPRADLSPAEGAE